MHIHISYIYISWNVTNISEPCKVRGPTRAIHPRQATHARCENIPERNLLVPLTDVSLVDSPGFPFF